MGEGDAGACCAVVATAEYCTGVVAALASNVAKLLYPFPGEQVRGRTNLKLTSGHVNQLGFLSFTEAWPSDRTPYANSDIKHTY